MLWMICYDISNDRTRCKASQCLLRYGERVQRSIYECHLSPRELSTLKRELDGIIDPTADRIRFYPQCQRDRSAIRVDGHGPEVTTDPRFRMV